MQIEKDDTLPQQVCVACAKNAISACLFKKKCEDADNFFRQQLLIKKFEGRTAGGCDIIPLTTKTTTPTSKSVAQQLQGTASEGDDSELDQSIKVPIKNEQNSSNNHTHENEDEQIVEDDGEIKTINGKTPFDFHSIRMMHEYMQQQLNKFHNGTISTRRTGDDDDGSGSELGDDEEPLPLIPEIELLTPSEEMGSGLPLVIGGNASSVSQSLGQTQHMRGYQCPTCFQIFEMKQILKAHMQSVHGTTGPVYECSNCKKTYFYKRFLEKHVRRGRCVKKRRNQT